jgi:hypothetical protein
VRIFGERGGEMGVGWWEWGDSGSGWEVMRCGCAAFGKSKREGGGRSRNRRGGQIFEWHHLRDPHSVILPSPSLGLRYLSISIVVSPWAGSRL